jgi:hypothetical protein
MTGIALCQRGILADKKGFKRETRIFGTFQPHLNATEELFLRWSRSWSIIAAQADNLGGDMDNVHTEYPGVAVVLART